MAAKVKKMKYYITSDRYFGFCVKSEESEKIVFAGSIEDCNRRCADFNDRAELLEKLQQLEVEESATDLAESEMMADPENAEKEAAFDAAYRKEFNTLLDAVHALQKISGDKIEFITAKKIVISKRSELYRILGA